jgi:hypothetical protein
MIAMFDLDKSKALGRVLLDVVQPQADEHVRDWAARAKQWGMANPTHPASIELKRRYFSGTGDARDFAWFVAWTMNAFPRLLLTDKQAASFMATNAGEPEQMNYAPWSAYTIELPHESLQVTIDGRMHAFDVVEVVHDAGGPGDGFVVRGRHTEIVISGRLAFPLPEWPDGVPSMVRDNEDVLNRVRDCVARLVISVELAMSNRDVVIFPSTKKPKMGKSLNDPGVHRLAIAVRVDCREAIKDYLSGERGKSPTVRWLARGHWKPQPYGPRNSLRKQIYIEPYWNPKDSDKPIAERPHKLVTRKKK